MRMLVALLGLAVIMAIFAGIHYSEPATDVEQRTHPAYVLAPGEARSFSLQPSLEGSAIAVEFLIVGGPVDIYTMPSYQAASIPRGGVLDLSRPFSYDAQYSLLDVNGQQQFAILSDGVTYYDVILDNSDNYYDGDATPNGTVTIQVTHRYVEEEERTLVLGYLATIPSILLVVITVWRKLARRSKDRAAPDQP